MTAATVVPVFAGFGAGEMRRRRRAIDGVMERDGVNHVVSRGERDVLLVSSFNHAPEVQPSVATPDGRLGVQTGELLLVTEEGAQRLHTFPEGMVRAA